jgi:hypothetical protein
MTHASVACDNFVRNCALPRKLLALLLLSLRLDWLPGLRGPGPFPEWQWPYAPQDPIPGLLEAAGWAALLVLLPAVTGLEVARRRPRSAAALVLTLATLFGFSFQLSLLASTGLSPGSEWMRRAAEPTTISYFNVAISSEADDAALFLDRHAELMPGFAQSALHASMHPPGPVLYFRALLGLFRATPRLTGALVDLALSDVEVRALARTRVPDPILATATVGVALLSLMAVLSCWPIALWAWSTAGDPLAAARVAALWPLVPAPALFVGAIYLALALPITLAGAALCLALSQSRRSRLLMWSLLAGLSAGAALQTSYGAPVFLAMVGAVALVPIDSNSYTARRLGVICVVGGASAALIVLAPLAFGHEPLMALRTALDLHLGLVTTHRSYFAWLVHNPIDFTLFVGVPLVALGAARALAALRARLSGPRVSFGPAFWRQLTLGVGFGILILSGSVRGEVGRVWIPLMPVVLIVCTSASAREENGSAGPAIREASPAIREALWLAAALAACTLTLRASWGF